jgi:hypothetical protein
MVGAKMVITTHLDVALVENHSMIPEDQPADLMAEVEYMKVREGCQSSRVGLTPAAS